MTSIKQSHLSSLSSLPSIPTPLNEKTINSLHPVKLFTYSNFSVPYTSITHNPQGSHFITTSPNGSLQLYDSVRGKMVRPIYSKKYGCSNATFTLRSINHAVPDSCIIASTIPTTTNNILNNSLRLLDLNKDSFIRYFQGHTDQVTSIISSTSSIFGIDSFYSSSNDGTIRAWDSRSDRCYSCLSGMGKIPIISIDQSGLIMAIYNNSKVSIVSIDSFPKGLIGEVVIDIQTPVEKLIWSNKTGLLVVDSPGHDKLVIDTNNLKVISKLTGLIPFQLSPDSDDVLRNGSCDITPDGLYCISGNGDGTILAWDLSKCEESDLIHPIVIKGDFFIEKKIVPRILNINPKFGTIVTGDTEIVINMYDSL